MEQLLSPNGTAAPEGRRHEPTARRSSFRIVSLRDERLTRKVTLAFGFMSFIPLLLVFWAFLTVVRPNLQGRIVDQLSFVIIAIIGSVFVGYFVLRWTMNEVLRVIQQARVVADKQIGAPVAGDGNELGELARTFNRITRELEQKIEDLETSRALIKRLLSRIGTAIISYEGIDNLLELIVENATTALEADMGSLLLVEEPKREELVVKSTWSVTGQAEHVERMRLGEGIVGWVAKENTTMRASGTPAAVGLVSDLKGECAVLCVPLIIRDKTLGVILLLRTDPKRQFEEDDELVLSNIGSQIAVAIENYRLNQDIEHTYFETIMALALAVEAKEPHTAGHSKRVGYYSVKIGEMLGLDDETLKMLKHGGLLHDIGKIGIKDDILMKPSALTPEEWRVMQQHSVIGEAILKPVRSLTKVSELVRCHHEWYDGSGYPSGIKGEAIPLGARILTVADAYDAMATDRPYRRRLSLDEAKAELRRGAGKQFDPKVIDAFLKVLSEKEQRLSPAQSE
jgi:putative methionine-R-sulfoxide reductase with GAF domain